MLCFQQFGDPSPRQAASHYSFKKLLWKEMFSCAYEVFVSLGGERTQGGTTSRRRLGRGGRDAYLQGGNCLYSQVQSIFKVVREVGKRLMEKAYMGIPHTESSALSIEE